MEYTNRDDSPRMKHTPIKKTTTNKWLSNSSSVTFADGTLQFTLHALSISFDSSQLRSINIIVLTICCAIFSTMVGIVLWLSYPHAFLGRELSLFWDMMRLSCSFCRVPCCFIYRVLISITALINTTVETSQRARMLTSLSWLRYGSICHGWHVSLMNDNWHN